MLDDLFLLLVWVAGLSLVRAVAAFIAERCDR